MRAFKVLKLNFRTPLRVGEAGIGLERTGEIIHSDTLFAAIANALGKLNEDVEEFVNKVRNGEVRFSSCFPFRDGTYYLPAPHLPIEKKWKYLPLNDFEKVISGNIPDGTKNEVDFITKVEIPKVVLDRVTSNSGIYYLTALKFTKDSGLYFIVDGKDRLIKLALKYLQDEGIGGKRTWGLGKFEANEDEIKIKEDGDYYVTLSVTYPRDVESVVYWKPIVRSGWISSKNATLRKPKIIMASEGSIFKNAEEGEVINLSIAYSDLPSIVGHEVWVNGKSFLIGMVIKDEA